MRKQIGRFVIVLAATAIAGCSEAADDAGQAPEAEPAEAAVAAAISPGLYAVGNEDTEYGRTQLNEDGTYIDMADNTVVGSGTWTADGATMCFDPAGDEEHQQVRCWINSPPGDDGSFITARDDDSETYRVTPIAE